MMRILLHSLAALLLLAAPAAAEEAKARLRLIETTDIHANLLPYDYYRDRADDGFGLARTAAVIAAARGEARNVLLIDNGDLIQGSPLGDYMARERGLKAGEVHPVYKAMNLMGYDAGNIGNHDFNYGLDFLKLATAGARFPYVNANIYVDDHDGNPDNDANYFTPYLILERSLADAAGKAHPIRIGIIGFVPPQVMQWDKSNLEGKVTARDIVATAKRFVPEMRAKGADLVIAVPHSGFAAKAGATNDRGLDENAVYDLARVPGIDAILFGHAHGLFPGEAFKTFPGADIAAGTINGVPAVMPGFWGSHAGIIDLDLALTDGKWRVSGAEVALRPVFKTVEGKKVALVESDPGIVAAVAPEHEATLAYVRQPIGATAAPITSYFALVQDDPSIQVVTEAQARYVERAIAGTEYDGLPVLSAGAPFKAGGRGGADYYTDVPAGPLAIKNAADLYLYPNTLRAVLLTGAEVKEWLEMAAGQFNRIDPAGTEEQALVNPAFPSYNFDVIDGVTYRIDVSQPARYDKDGKLVAPEASRIRDLSYRGRPLDPQGKFIVATNNYRAGGGGHFPGLTGENIVVDSPDENRQVLIDYIIAHKTIDPTADGNWSFVPLPGHPNVTFLGSPGAQKYLPGQGRITYAGEGADGFAKYRIELGQ